MLLTNGAKSVLHKTVKHLCGNLFTLRIDMLFASSGAFPLALRLPFGGGFTWTLHLLQSEHIIGAFSSSSMEGIVLLAGG